MLEHIYRSHYDYCHPYRNVTSVPHHESDGQKSGYDHLIPRFRILIFSAVKICKQCLETASAFGGRRSQDPYRVFAPGPNWELSSPDSLGYRKNPVHF